MDEPSVRALWAALDQAWNGRQADRFGDLFTTDASFEIGGDALSGREAIQRGFSQRFAQLAPELRHRTTVKDFQALAPGLASVDAGVEIAREAPRAAAAPTVIRRFALVAVMSRTAEGWKIRLLRAFAIPEPASESGCPRP
jgi:uncharacterized protein (TIGR02246 family)